MSAPVRRIEGVAAILPLANIDTDRIIPARFLQLAKDSDDRRILFHDLRFTAERRADPAFVLNRPAFAQARILVAGANFGCGSSREQAVWALKAFGIGAVIAPSFGDIFFNNALKNALVPVVLPRPDLARLEAALACEEGATVAVDLAAQRVEGPGGLAFPFSIPDRARRSILDGIEEVELTLRYAAEIEAFEERTRTTLLGFPLRTPKLA